MSSEIHTHNIFPDTIESEIRKLRQRALCFAGASIFLAVMLVTILVTSVVIGNHYKNHILLS